MFYADVLLTKCAVINATGSHMILPFVFENCGEVTGLCFMWLVEQKQSILLLQQMSFNKRKIMQMTWRYSEEYDAALAAPPFAPSYWDF